MIDFKINGKLTFVSIFIVVLLVISIWYGSLSPYQRCITEACREQAVEAMIAQVEGEHAPRIEAANRAVLESAQKVEESRRRLREIDDAIRSVECQKNGRVC